MILDICLVCVLLLYKFPSCSSARNNISTIQECETPNRVPGYCVPIYDCPFLIKVIQDGVKDSLVRSHLQDYKCGFHNIVHVCCPHMNEPLLDHRYCGLVGNNKIFPGAIPYIYDFSWNVLIDYDTENGTIYLCGGSVLNTHYILTSAHCVKDLNEKYKLNSVRIGAHNTKRTIIKAIPHPDYDPITLDNNIGMLRLNSSENITAGVWIVASACLPLFTHYIDYEKGYFVYFMTGWGTNHFAWKSDIKLLAWNYTIIPNDKCRIIYERMEPHLNLTIGKNQMCVVEEEFEKGKYCVGERGDAFLIHRNLHGIQIGIMSYASKMCNNRNLPKIITKTYPYVRWILDNIEP